MFWCLAKQPYMNFAEQQNFERVAENKKNALLVPRLVKVYTSLTKIFSHKRQHFLVSRKITDLEY